jgi:hypothetical protein
MVLVRSRSTPSSPMDAAAPAAERGGVDGRVVPEEGLAREALEMRVLHPAGDDGLVGQAEGVLEAHQPRDQARVDGRASLVGGKEAGPFPLEPGPVDQGGEPDQLVLAVDHVEQAWPQQVGLFGRARAVLHARRNRRK